jgi:hypothetical protein
MTARRGYRVTALCVAVGGALLGHWLTYVLIAPAGGAREALLRHTGHGYLAVANDVGLVLALGSLGAVFLRGLTAPGAPPTSGTRLLGRLSLFQSGAFGVMEVLERVTSGAPLDGLLRDGLLPVGLLVQVGVAAGCAILIGWLVRAAALVVEVIGPHEPRVWSAPVPFLAPVAPAGRSRIAWTRPCLRAPPSAV